MRSCEPPPPNRDEMTMYPYFPLLISERLKFAIKSVDITFISISRKTVLYIMKKEMRKKETRIVKRTQLYLSLFCV